MLSKTLCIVLLIFSSSANADLLEFSRTFKKLLQEKELLAEDGELRLHDALIRTCDIYHMDVTITSGTSQKLATYYLEQQTNRIVLKILKGQKIITELNIVEYNESSFYAAGEGKDSWKVFTCKLKGIHTICEEWQESDSVPRFDYKYFSELLN